MYKYLIIWACYICSSAAYGQICNQVFVSSITEFTSSSATITWIYPGTGIPLGYEIELGIKGFSQTGTATTDLITTTTYVYDGLESAQTYQFWIRAVCESDQSEWNGPFEFNTNIINPSECSINLAIDNNNCPDVNQYNIEVSDYPGALLGQDIILDKIEILINHTWVPDLKLQLRSPNGIAIPLIEHRGIGSQHLGDINDCISPLSFTADACLSITEAPTPYIGTYRPEGDLNQFLDGSPANGIWQLEICDRAKGDIGSLNYVALGFSEQNCTLPFTIRISEIKGTSVLLNWDQTINCDGIELEVGPVGFLPGSVPITFVNCETESLLIDNLDANTEYEFYIRSVCGLTNSAYSCPFTFITACNLVSNQTTFDKESICPTNCNQPCLITDTWTNSLEDDHDWIVNQGSTPTDFTGPTKDANDFGNYVYLENTELNCTAGAVAILESACLKIAQSDDDCDLQFYYHMYGSDISSLRLEITLDDGITWLPLWEQNGDQGNQWILADVNLNQYTGSLARLRFIATTGEDIFSDIAIDEITFFNSILEDPILYYFDSDGDGFGLSDRIITSCTSVTPAQYATQSGDCNDDDNTINPNSEESPCNLIDDDCDGSVDNISIPNPLGYSLVFFQNETCLGANDGFIEIIVGGGSPPYEVNWNTNQSGRAILNASEGVYFAIIQDGDGCQIQTEFIEIDADNTVDIFLESLVSESCLGAFNGSLEVLAGGGQGPYTFQWSNGLTTPKIDNLGAGNYHVIATDAIGCKSDTAFFEINFDPSIVAGIASLEHVSCFSENNGSITLGIINGSAPFDIVWSTGDHGMHLDNLEAGLYYASITDADNCMLELGPIQVEQPDSITIQIDNIQRISCPTERDGRIEISIVGGEGPYTYQWNNGNLTDDLFLLESGYYSITVTDSQACKAVKDSIFIDSPPPLSIAIDTIIDVDCPLSTDGAIQSVVTGGNGDYSYFWSHDENANRDFIEDLQPGFYRLTTIDRFGCKATKGLIEVESRNREILIDLQLEEDNDCADQSNAILSALVDEAEFPVAYNWSYGVEHIESSLSDTLKNLPAGMYNITVTDRDGCTGISEVITIDEILSIGFDIVDVVDNSCESDSFGLISISILNANEPAQVIWNNGSIGSTVELLPNGSYSASIIDANGCQTQTQEITINSDFQLGFESIVVPETQGQQNGSITIIPEGNATDYFIIWEDFPQYDGQFFVENLSNGTYAITLMDSNGCSYTDQVLIGIVSSIDPSIKSKLKVFPNPAQDELNIEFSNTSSSFIELRIIDLQGVAIQQMRYDNLSDTWRISIPIADLTSGIYMLNISTNNGIITKRFVKI